MHAGTRLDALRHDSDHVLVSIRLKDADQWRVRMTVHHAPPRAPASAGRRCAPGLRRPALRIPPAACPSRAPGTAHASRPAPAWSDTNISSGLLLENETFGQVQVFKVLYWIRQTLKIRASGQQSEAAHHWKLGGVFNQTGGGPSLIAYMPAHDSQSAAASLSCRNQMSRHKRDTASQPLK